MPKNLLGISKSELFSAVQKNIKIKSISNNDIAIVGMAGKFGDTESIWDFWQNIKNGKDCIRSLSETRKKDANKFLKKYGLNESDVQYAEGAYLDEIDKFDSAFFQIPPKECSMMDPSQRLFLETVWEALEDSGYGGLKLAGSRTGVFVGYTASNPSYEDLLWEVESSINPGSMAGNISSIIASRIAYIMDFRGPCIMVDTACSSSLVAVHVACQAIRNGECDMAIAGGVKVIMFPAKLKDSENVGISSSDGRTRTFDDSSDGTVSGEGIAAILLKPLSRAIDDQDHIYAVIKGSAVNNDGRSIGITAPNSLAQKDVIIKAWEESGINPETISYIEAHGTGTKLGDPIEIDGLRRAFSHYTQKKQFCAISSIKTNIGHTDSAAGITGLIKAVLALYNKELPPSLNFIRPNRKISFEDSPVYVNERLKSWDVDDSPRRCGVSSFGLSGTNCHVVLEEGPFVDNTPLSNNGNKNIFTQSAKSKKALKELVEKYTTLIEKNPSLCIDDICYTVNTGRGHYNHRLAIVTNSIEDFKKKLIKIINNEFEGINDDSIFYKEHKIVAQNKNNRRNGEILDSEKIELCKKANLKINEYLQSRKADDECLKEICRLYTMGADIQWEELYKDIKKKKVSLPVYSFERKRFWVEDKEARKDISKPLNQNMNNYQSTENKFDIKLAVESADVEIYTFTVSFENNWTVNEHQINGAGMLVGTSYLEIVLQAYHVGYGKGKVTIKDITLLKPMILKPSEIRDVQVVIRKDHNKLMNFSIISRLQDEYKKNSVEWEKHAAGKLYRLDFQPREVFNLEELKRRYGKQIVQTQKERVLDNDIVLGQRWHSLKHAYVGNNEALGYLELQEEFKDDIKDFILHPALLDTALNLAGRDVTGNDFYFPFYFKEVNIFESLPNRFFSLIKGNGKTAETFSFDITLIDEYGKKIAEFIEYTIRKSFISVTASNDKMYYEIKWVPEELKYINGELNNGSVIVFKGQNVLSDKVVKELKALNKEIIIIEHGECFEKIDECRYVIGRSRNDYEELLKSIGTKSIAYIIHLLTACGNGEIEEIEDLQKNLENGVYSLFHLASSLTINRYNENIEIVVVTNSANEVTGDEIELNPHSATLIGLSKVIGQENTNLTCRSIDIDDGFRAEDLIAELRVGENSIKCPAYRNGIRYVELLSELDIENQIPSEVDIMEDGVYIITGGTGGIGLEFSKYIASLNKVNLVLINRTNLPEREQWKQIVDEGIDDKLSGKVRSILEIEASGSNVFLYHLDVSDFSQMDKLFKDLERRFGKINGIIHCAGIAGDKMLITKGEADFKKVLAPKVIGSWIIDRLTAKYDINFFIMCSSVTSLTGGIGQGDYTAANSYLDAFAAYRRKKGKSALTINWTAWRKTGMTLNYSIDENDAFRPISSNQAISIFHKILSKDIQRVIISELNYSKISQMEVKPFRLSENISRFIEKNTFSQNKGDSLEVPVSAEIKLMGKDNGEYTDSEIKIGQVWGMVLGIEEVDVYDNFFNLGGDSIYAMKIANLINSNCGFEVGINDILQYQNINALAEYVESFNETKEIGSNILKTIEIAEPMELYPVTPSQKRIFVLQQFDGIDSAYNIPDVININGPINRETVRKALQGVIDRHEILRTTFLMRNGEIKQKVHKKMHLSMDYVQAQETEIDDIIKAFIKPFDLEKGPLLRATFVKLEERKHILLLDFHHIVTDWASNNIFVEEFCNLYLGNELIALKIQFKDYAVWHSKIYETDYMKKQEQYWLSVFSDTIPVLNLPTDYPRQLVRSYKGDRITFELDKDLTERVNKLARDTGSTLYMVLLSVYNILLSKFTGQEDIVVGSACSGRIHPDVGNLIGMFVNSVAIRNYPKSDVPFEEFLTSVRENSLNALKNQDYPIEEIVRKLKLGKDRSRNPLFDTVFILENIEVKKMEINGLEFSNRDFEFHISKFDLSLYAMEDQTIKFSFEYSFALFKEETVRKMADLLVRIIKQVVDNPEVKLADIQLMTEEERKNLLTNLKVTSSIGNSIDIKNEESTEGEMEFEFDF